MTFFKKKMRQLGASTPVAAVLICGCVNLLTGILIRVFVGSPRPTLFVRHVEELVPPVWLTAFLWSVAFFTVGAVFGGVLFRRRGPDAERYRGGMLYLILLFSEYLWYPLFFGAGQAFLSFLLVAVIIALCVLIALSWWRFCRTAAILTAIHGAFCLYFFVLMLMILFHG